MDETQNPTEKELSLMVQGRERTVYLRGRASPCEECGVSTRLQDGARPDRGDSGGEGRPRCPACLLHLTARGIRQMRTTSLFHTVPKDVLERLFRTPAYRVRGRCRSCGRLYLGECPPQCVCKGTLEVPYRFGPFEEIQILQRLLNLPQETLAEAWLRWLGVVASRPQHLPDLPQEYRTAWTFEDVEKTHAFAYPSGTGTALLVDFPFYLQSLKTEPPALVALRFNEALERAFEVLPAEHFTLFGYAGKEDFREHARKQYDALTRAIDRYNEQVKSPAEPEAEKDELPFDVVLDETQTREVRNYHDMLMLILARAYDMGASDIHMETVVVDPSNHVRAHPGLFVRVRVDGLLHPLILPGTFSQENRAAEQMFNIVKNLCGFEAGIRETPQDGSFTVRVKTRLGEKSLFCRVSLILCETVRQSEETFPVYSCVLRILDPSIIQQSLDDLGYCGPAAHLFFHTIDRQQRGLIALAGETGSGKSTTLHMTLKRLYEREGDTKKYLSVEDPIEYRQHFIRQVEVFKDREFATAARAFVRHDPDIIIVGEIRDVDTARQAVMLALSGHLVLTTLHAQSLADIFKRLTHFGVEPLDLASGCTALVSQMLVRKPCPQCAVRVQGADLLHEELRRFLEEAHIPIPLTGLRGTGCRSCGGTGFRGRIHIMEIARMGRNLRKVIRDGHEMDLMALLNSAIQDGGYVSMLEDCSHKILSQRVDARELERVAYVNLVTLQTLADLGEALPRPRAVPPPQQDGPVPLKEGA